MARAQSTDMYHGFKYRVSIPTQSIDGASSMAAGFSSVSVPDATIEQVEYKEGTYLYRRKYPGDVTFSDISLVRGVAKKRTAFYDWARACYLGKEYRVDLIIHHFHRDETADKTSLAAESAKRQIKCYECFAIRVKPAGDFDAQSSDISLEEMDVALESFELSDGNAAGESGSTS